MGKKFDFYDKFKWIKCFAKYYVKYGHWDFFDAFNIEINTSCNRRCSYCPNSIYERGLVKNEKLMQTEVYHKLIDELAEFNFRGRISPQCYGEPLLDKRLESLMLYTRKKLPKATITILSNGDVLSVDKFYRLLKSGVDKFFITQHGESINDNMKELFNHLKGNKKLIKKIRYEHFKDTIPLSNRGGLVKPLVLNTTPRCYDPINPVTIDYDGNVILCCNDYFSSVIFGNIKRQKLIDIWFTDKYRNFRKQFRTKYYTMPICLKCIGEID